MGLRARPVLLRLGREREDPGLLGLGQFPEASLEGDDAVGDLRQQIEAGVPDTLAAGRVVACRVRKAKSWPGPLRLASRRRASIDGPFADAPSHSSAKARCAGLASSSLPTTSAGSPGSVASAARRSGPNGEACGTPSTNRRAFTGSSMMRLFTISRTGPNGERAGMAAMNGSISSGGF